MSLLDQLTELHRKELRARKVSYKEADVQRFRMLFAAQPPERIRREIAAKIRRIENPVTQKEIEEAKERRKEAAKAAQEEIERAEKRREEWRREHQEIKDNFDPNNYDGLKALEPGFEFDLFVTGELISIEELGTLRIKIEDPGFCEKHMYAGKTYDFELHLTQMGDFNTWTLKGDQHECAEQIGDHYSYGADVVLVYDGEQWLWDLDS